MIPTGPFDDRTSAQASAACIPDRCENELILNPGFRGALEEMEALGLHVTDVAHTGSIPYGVLPGNERSRWWLVPLHPRAVSISSLALIQPMRRGARLLRQAAVIAGRFGLPWQSLGRRLHISGDNNITRTFGPRFAHSAFFTGTASPHRKLVVQLMDESGAIQGYAKVSRVPAVHALLANEVAVMREMRGLGLRTAIVPEVLLHEVRDATAILVTDTTKKPSTRCVRRLTQRHLRFLDEMAERTSSLHATSGAAVLQGETARLREMEKHLSDEWQQRLQSALDYLSARPELIEPKGLAHGDFTPWNIFRHENRLCVIDWEYASNEYPADYDLIHFLFALSGLESSPPAARCRRIHRLLIDRLGRSADQAHARLLAYLCARALFLARRLPRPFDATLQWDGERDLAIMLGALAVSAKGE